MAGNGMQGRNWVLAAMIFAVSMTFIDQTIVSIAVPNIQRELGLSSTGVQWVVNGYLIALSALFALGGRLSDIFGHRKLCVIGVIVFVVASTMCGLTPTGSAAEAWIVSFRVIQGAGGALMFPAALAIVVNTFPLRERGKALALFFGIAGGLTAIGPLLGGYLTEWTWRAIFWVNIPVALIALVLIAVSKPKTQYKRAPIDYRGAVLIAVGIGLSIFGLQQSALWGWSNPATWICIVAGLLIIGLFVLVELRTASPLIKVSIFRIQAFTVENIVLLIAMMAFIPIFFFASEYAQISLHKSASEAGVFLLFFFIGFVIAAQIGGRILDRVGSEAGGRARLRHRRGRLRPLGVEGRHPELRQAADLGHRGRSRDGNDAGTGQHRCDQPGQQSLLRRGDRHHADHPELRGQPGSGRPGDDPAVQLPLAPDVVTPEDARPECRRGGQLRSASRPTATRCPPSRTTSRSISPAPRRPCST